MGRHPGRCVLMLIWSFVSVIPIVQPQFEGGNGYNENHICPRTGLWSFAENMFDGTVHCFTLVPAMTFEEAQSYCHANQAHVLSLGDPVELFIPFNGPLQDLLRFNGIENIWNGHYVEEDKLRRDQFPLPPTHDDFSYASAVKYNIPWEWNEPRGTSQCFKTAISCPVNLPDEGFQGANFSDYGNIPPTGGLAKRSVDDVMKRSVDDVMKRSAHDAVGKVSHTDENAREKRALVDEQGDLPCFGSQVRLESHPCSDPLPFVCFKPALRKSSVFLQTVKEICQPDEFGSYHLSRCISYGNETVNATTALSRCQEKGEELGKARSIYRAHSPESVQHFNQLVVDLVHREEGITDTYSSRLPPYAMAWVGGGKDTEDCVGLMMSSPLSADSVSWDCEAQLPYYICQRPVDRKRASNLQLTYEYSAPATDKTLAIVEEDIPSTTDRQIAVPVDLANFRGYLSMFLSCEYQGFLVPEIQNLTIVKGGLIVSGIPDAVLLQPSYSQALRAARQTGANVDTLSMRIPDPGNYFVWGKDPLSSMADYYWCEVNDLKSGNVRRSNRMFLRIKGMQIYTASITLKTSYEERSDLVIYSLSGYDRNGQVDTLNGMMANATLYSHRWLRFRHDLTNENSTWTVADFYVFKRAVTDLVFKPTNWTLANTEALLRNDFQNNLNTTFFWIDTLRLKSLDICPYTQVYDPVSNRTYEIPDTPLGQTYTSPLICLSNGRPYVTLACTGDKLYGARWSRFEPNSGCDFTNRTSSPVTSTLKNLSMSDINNTTVSEAVDRVVTTVSNLITVEPVDVVYIADIIQKATNVSNISKETGQKILQIVDTVNKLNDTELNESQNIGNATNRIIQSMDQLGDNIDLGGEPRIRLVTDSTALEVWNLSRVSDDVIIGLELRLDGGEPVPVLNNEDLNSLFESERLTYQDTDAAVVLSGHFVRRVKDANAGKDMKLAMNVYAGTNIFSNGRLYSGPNESSTNWTLNSQVVSAKMTVDGQSISALGNDMVTTVFLPSIPLPDESRAQNSSCVFWDLSGAGGRGAWSEEGCRYLKTLNGRDVCVCDHLTNFAVLVDLYGQGSLPQEHQFALTLITIIGLSLSIAGLSITILSFICIKKLRQGRPQQTLFNMALAMLASWIVFLAGFTRVESHVGCLAVAALLHYFILASFMWMLMEGILQYLLFVRVFGTEYDNYMLKTAIPAWSIPLIPVIVVLAIDTNLYRGGDQYCWMSLTPFYYAFLLPVALIMFANIIIYIMVVVAICRRRDVTSHASKSAASQRVIGIRASVACFVVLGLSWVFAFFAVEDARVVFQYLFTITSSIQGFLIFLIFTARDPQVRAFWKATCCRSCTSQDKETTVKTHAQAQRSHSGSNTGSHSGSDDYPLNGSRHDSSYGEDSRYHVNSRKTSSFALPSSSGAYVRGSFGNGYGGYGNPGYNGYM